MVQIGELPEELQEKIRNLFKGIQEMDNRPEHPGFGPIYVAPAYFAVYLVKCFRDGEDSWKFLQYKDDVSVLKDHLDKNEEAELLRDLLEMECELEKLPTEAPCWF